VNFGVNCLELSPLCSNEGLTIEMAAS